MYFLKSKTLEWLKGISITANISAWEMFNSSDFLLRFADIPAQ